MLPVDHLSVWRNDSYLLPIFRLVCFFVIELYELILYFGNKHLLALSFTNIFSQPTSCLCVLFMVFFAVQKHISFTGFHLFIFAFISVALGD